MGNISRRSLIVNAGLGGAGVLLAACATGCDTDSGKPTTESGKPTTDSGKPTTDSGKPTAGSDIVLRGGQIQTMTTDEEVVSAVAVKDGTIVYVGDDAGVEEYIDDSTKIIELDGMYVLPGFIDGHNHGAGHQLEKEYNLYLMETEATPEAYQQAMREFREANPDMEYIPGNGLDLNAFENNAPTHELIDEIIPDACVFINDMSMHGMLLNQKAMDELGITKDTKDPDGGNIYRDADGNPTGYFSDCGELLDGLSANISYTDEQKREAQLQFMEEMNSHGITAYQQPGGGWDNALDIYTALAKEGKLTMRISNAENLNEFSVECAEELVKAYDGYQKTYADYNDWVRVTLAKNIIDGVPEGMTALLTEPYDPAAGMPDDYVGPVYTTQEILNEMTAVLDKAGYSVEIHAMGDGGVNMALNAFEYCLEQNGEHDARHQIAHVTLMKDEDIPRMGELKVIGAMQPMWFYYDPFFSPLEEMAFGADRFAKEYRIKDMLEEGVVMTGSIDYSVTLEVRPLTGIQAGATQCSPFDAEEDSDDFLRNPNQAVSVMDMIKMYTVNGAFALKMEDLIGTIEVGKKGDFVVLGQNLLECDVKDVANTGIMYTISDGRVVFEGKERTVDALPIQ